MNRAVKLVLAFLAAEASLAALAVVAWGWRGGLIGPGGVQRPLMLAFLFVFPVLMWGVLAWVSPQLASHRPRLAEDHRRHLQGQLCFYFVLLAGLQAWLANLYLGAAPPPLDRASFARLAFILMGAAMAVRGNFVAKLSPPTGDGAPEPGAWTRSMLRTGWAMTLVGAALVVCAIVLPLRGLVLVTPVVAIALVAVGRAHRRATRPQEAGR